MSVIVGSDGADTVIFYVEVRELDDSAILLTNLMTTEDDFDRTILLQSGYEAQPLPILIGTWPQSRPILPNLYALGAATTAVTLAIIAVVLIAGTFRLRKRGAPVHSVEEEFGVEPGGGIKLGAADADTR